MSGYFWVSYGLLWMLTIGLGVLVVLLLREIGRAYLTTQQNEVDPNTTGPEVGASLPPLAVQVDGGSALLPALTVDSAFSMVLVTRSDCPICPKAAAAVGTWTKKSGVVEGILLAEPGESPYQAQSVDSYRVAISTNEEIESQLEIVYVPFALFVDRDGQILSKGIVNDEKDLDRIASRAPQAVYTEVARQFATPNLELHEVSKDRARPGRSASTPTS